PVSAPSARYPSTRTLLNRGGRAGEDGETMTRWLARIFGFSRGSSEVEAMPFIVGSPRSGTTLLRFMLDSHPELAIPPETGFLLIGKELSGTGDDLREQFFQAITSYPPEAPGWADFHIPTEEFHARLGQLRPFTVADGFRLFYRMYAERFGKRRWGE